jgi:hypothetical protein
VIDPAEPMKEPDRSLEAAAPVALVTSLTSPSNIHPSEYGYGNHLL